jgi:hypothetical protein
MGDEGDVAEYSIKMMYSSMAETSHSKTTNDTVFEKRLLTSVWSG